MSFPDSQFLTTNGYPVRDVPGEAHVSVYGARNLNPLPGNESSDVYGFSSNTSTNVVPGPNSIPNNDPSLHPGVRYFDITLIIPSYDAPELQLEEGTPLVLLGLPVHQGQEYEDDIGEISNYNPLALVGTTFVPFIRSEEADAARKRAVSDETLLANWVMSSGLESLDRSNRTSSEENEEEPESKLNAQLYFTKSKEKFERQPDGSYCARITLAFSGQCQVHIDTPTDMLLRKQYLKKGDDIVVTRCKDAYGAWSLGFSKLLKEPGQAPSYPLGTDAFVAKVTQDPKMRTNLLVVDIKRNVATPWLHLLEETYKMEPNTTHDEEDQEY